MNLLMYPREQAWSPGLHFFRNFGSFGVLNMVVNQSSINIYHWWNTLSDSIIVEQ